MTVETESSPTANETTPLVTAGMVGVRRESLRGNDMDEQHDVSSNNASSDASSTSSSSSLPSTSPSTTPIAALVETIGCRHLPVWNMESYIVVQYGTQILHRTKPYVPKISKTEKVSRFVQVFGGNNHSGNSSMSNIQRNLNNPIWTVREDCVMSVIVSSKDMDNHKALILQVWCRPRPVSLGGKAMQMVADSLLLGGGTTGGVNINMMGVVENETDADILSDNDDDEADDDDVNQEMDAAVDALHLGGDQNNPTASNKSAPGSPAKSSQQNNQQQIQLRNNNQPVFIGKVRIPCTELLKKYTTGQRIEVPLLDELGRPILQPGTNFATTLSIRCRMASQADLNFCRTWPKYSSRLNSIIPTPPTQHQHSLTSLLLKEAQVIQEPERIRATLITELAESEMIGASFSSAVMNSGVSPTNYLNLLSKHKIKVKPYPDLSSKDMRNKTQFLAKEILKTLTAAPSRNWIQAGSMGESSSGGDDMRKQQSSSSLPSPTSKPNSKKYGRLYIEILSCHDLPNVDFGSKLGNQTDCFCSVVYGDCMVETDVIDDELSPHWLPWTQRSFCFALGHPSQVAYVGVFGYKRNPMIHAPIGRVEVNISNMQHDTLYDLRYDLKAQSHAYNGRVSNGSIRVRVRVEVDDERQYLLASLTLPPSIYINVTRKKSMRVARYTAMGECDTQDRFQLSVLQGYIDEIHQGYVRRIIYAVHDGTKSLMLWRNQVFWGKEDKFGFPLYSLLVFIMCFFAVERPNLIPGMICLGLALFLLVQMQQRNRQPAPMKRCFSFWHYLQILATGISSPAFNEIKANQRLEELKALEEATKERIESDREFFGKKEAVEKVIEEIEHEKVTTKVQRVPLLEIMAVLGKVQGIVGNVCRIFRFVDAIVTWEESDISFFITLTLIIGGVGILFIPWGFILQWASRIALLVFLGPQNKILDMIYFRHIPTDEQKIRKIFTERMLKARVNQEDNRKLKAYRQVLYGKYSTSVPSIMWTPHNDFPEPDSTARYHGAASNIVPRIKDLQKCPFVPGQRLHGHMIPRPEEPYKRNQKASREVMKQYKRLMRQRRKKKKGGGDKPTDLSGIDVGSMGSEEGFEVMELYDEELGFVRDVLAAPKEDSTRELGVEILQNSNQDMFFQEAFKSVHDFSNIDGLSDLDDDSDDDSASSASESGGTGSEDDPIRLFDGPRKQFANTKASRQPRDESSLNLSKNGIEITEVSEREARFVRRSWKDRSSMSLNSSLPSVRFSLGDIQLDDETGDAMLESIPEMDAEDCKAYFTNELFGEASSGTGIEVTDVFESEVRFIEQTLSKDSANASVSTADDSKEAKDESSLDSGARYIENMISEDSIDGPKQSADSLAAASTTTMANGMHVDVDPEATPLVDNRDLLTLSPRHQGWSSSTHPTHFSFGEGNRSNSGSAQSRASPAATPHANANNDDSLDPIKTMSFSAESKEISACQSNDDDEYDDSVRSSIFEILQQQQHPPHETTIEVASKGSDEEGSKQDLGFEVMEY